MKRSPIGAKVRTRVQSERIAATALEGTATRLGLFQLHHVDFLHLEAPQRDKGTLKSGHPDYLIIGDGWSAYLEIKARNLETGRLGRLMPHQRTFHDKLRAAGHEVWVIYLPDDLQALNLLLRERTGVSVNVDGLLAPAVMAVHR